MVQNNSKKIILITGATSGIGEATAKILSENYNLILCGRRDNRLLEIEQTLSNKTEILTLNFDISNRNDVHDSINSIPDEWKHIDVLINNAGGAPLVKALSASNRFHEAIIDLNLTAPLNVSQRFAKIMMKQKTVSNIINISSVTANRPTPGSAAYGAAKGGLVNLTKTLAIEWAPKIKVNSIVVGYIETENSLVHYGSKKEMNKIAKTIPMKRMGKPSDIANACLFFASNLSEWVTGASLDVHGGGEKPTYLEVAKPK